MPFLAQNSCSVPSQDLLSWLFDDISYDLDKPIYIDAFNPTRTVSARRGRSLIRKIAAGLRKHGLQQGDCVILASFSDIYWPILALGIIAAGGVHSGTNPGYTPSEITHHVNTVHAKYVVCEPELLKSILEARPGIPNDNMFIFDTQGQAIPTGFKSWKTLLEHGETDWPRFSDPEASKTTNASLLFSSGTTGLPKAAQLTHHNWISQHTVGYGAQPPPYECRRLAALPMFHVASAVGSLLSPFRDGHVTYVMRRFELEPFLKAIQDYQITELVVVPPLVIGILMSPLTQKYSLISLRSVYCGAAPLEKGLQARFQALLAPGAVITQCWGMTEVSGVGSWSPYCHDNTGSVGRMVYNLDAKLVDDEGNDISAPGIRGELCVRGPIVFRGYYENEEANKRDFDNEGYFHTGDIAYVDGDTGLWYIVDRKKELIKVRGFQVAPPELEAVLLTHPSIIDAAVIGIPATSLDAASRDGELPRAYVVQRPGTGILHTQDVYEHAARMLAKYKRLEGGIRVVDAIPKTASGKILKKDLRVQAARELGAKL